MPKESDQLPTRAPDAEVQDFLRKIAEAPNVRPAGARGRLIFAMDATASREPTWDRACHLQAEMFEQTAALGGLDIQLVYYRGYRECKASPWVSDSTQLLRRMTAVSCLGGYTQIARVLRHAIAETREKKVNALVFVGDCVEEDADELCNLAGELGMLGVPVFVFHEGGVASAARVLRQIAQLSGGAYCPFDAASARQLRELLSAVAVYAAGGRRALEDFGKRAGGLASDLTRLLPRS
jgi:hypothetical protein